MIYYGISKINNNKLIEINTSYDYEINQENYLSFDNSDTAFLTKNKNLVEKILSILNKKYYNDEYKIVELAIEEKFKIYNGIDNLRNKRYNNSIAKDQISAILIALNLNSSEQEKIKFFINKDEYFYYFYNDQVIIVEEIN